MNATRAKPITECELCGRHVLLSVQHWGLGRKTGFLKAGEFCLACSTKVAALLKRKPERCVP